MVLNRHRDLRNQRNYSERLDRYGRPFGTRPSAKSTSMSYVRKPPAGPPKHALKEDKQIEIRNSPSDSHSYIRDRKISPPLRNTNNEYKRQTTQLRDGSRRRSLSFGNNSNGAQLVWKEKDNEDDGDHINTPFTTPVQQPEIETQTVQQLHDDIMTELQEVTFQYVNVSDPVESAARRQRVLECETQELMAKTAATLLAEAINTGNQNASNHAFYAALEQNEESPAQATEQIAAPTSGQAIEERSQLTQPRKRGRPPGRRSTNINQQALKGAGSKGEQTNHAEEEATNSKTIFFKDTRSKHSGNI
ncbi:hypothetical protein HID58_046345 [Brassica napus]|uniref:Uncharacterized protein n=1 Tax=Brassica napus TaxID=3708 RepID=A0ABQ8AW85_BRANA|nr:hypothetical protein HID58_046345 [Brassica napus]